MLYASYNWKKLNDLLNYYKPVNIDPTIPKEYASFNSSGEVALQDSEKSIPITILRDAGAVKSLILESTFR